MKDASDAMRTSWKEQLNRRNAISVRLVIINMKIDAIRIAQKVPFPLNQIKYALKPALRSIYTLIIKLTVVSIHVQMTTTYIKIIAITINVLMGHTH